MKKLLTIFTLAPLSFSACSTTIEEVSDYEINYVAPLTMSTDSEGELNIDIDSNDELRLAYNTVKDIFETSDLNNIAAMTTTTSNLLWSAGITPTGITSSNSIVQELKDKVCKTAVIDTSGDIDFSSCTAEQTIVEISNGLVLSEEITTALNPSLILISDAFPGGDHGSTSGLEVKELAQSAITDPFAIIQAIHDIATEENITDVIAKSQNVINEMNTDFKTLETKVSAHNGTTAKRTAVIQVVLDGWMVLNNNTAAGSVMDMIGLNNVYGNLESADGGVELSAESLIQINPDNIVLYGVGDDNEQAQIQLEAKLKESDGDYRSIIAVQNQDIFASTLTASLDFNILKNAITLQEMMFDSE